MTSDPATVAAAGWDTRRMRTRRVLRRAAAGVLTAAAVVTVTAVAAFSPINDAAEPAPAPPAGAVAYGPGQLERYTTQPQPAPGSCTYRRGLAGQWLPDPVCTPGALNPAVTARTIRSTICVKGWTDTIRPPGSVTSREKRANAAAYSYKGSLATAEYDHLVPLSLGGDPNDPRNLWVEPNDNLAATSTRNEKDDVEVAALRAVCSGKLDLGRAQMLAASDWTQLAATVEALGGHTSPD